jgi:hypothetical protein
MRRRRPRRAPSFFFKVTKETPAAEKPHIRGLQAAWASVGARWKESMVTEWLDELFLHWMIGDGALQEFLLAVESYYEACGWSWKPPRWATPYPWHPTTEAQRDEIRVQLSEPCPTPGCTVTVLRLNLDRSGTCSHCYYVRQRQIEEQKVREYQDEWKAGQAAQAGSQA